DRAALHVDAHTRADIALADEVTAAQGSAEGRARILLDHHGAGEHVLGARPADAALDADVGSVDQSAAEIAQAPFDGEIEAIENADREGMLGTGVFQYEAAEAMTHQLAQLEVDFGRRQGSGVELRALLDVDLEGLRIGEALLLL